MSGANYGQSPRRTRGRLTRSHSICSDTTTSQQVTCLSDAEDRSASRKTEVDAGRREEGGRERVRRPLSARRFRLTSSFDDGCSGRERVSARINSTTPDINSTLCTSSTSGENTNWMHQSDKQLDTSSGRNQSLKPRLRSSSVARMDVNRSTSNSTSSLNDQPRSNARQVEMKGQKESEINTNRRISKHADRCTAECSTSSNNTKKIMSNQKDMMSWKRPPPSLPVRTSLDMKSHNSDKPTTGGQSTPQRPRNRDQRNAKAGVPLSGTMSANSSPLPMRCAHLHSSCNHVTARYQCFSPSVTCGIKMQDNADIAILHLKMVSARTSMIEHFCKRLWECTEVAATQIFCGISSSSNFFTQSNY